MPIRCCHTGAVLDNRALAWSLQFEMIRRVFGRERYCLLDIGHIVYEPFSHLEPIFNTESESLQMEDCPMTAGYDANVDK